MELNPTHPGTYTGQEARIVLAVRTSRGRCLYALKTIGGTVATAWDTDKELREYAAQRRMVLKRH